MERDLTFLIADLSGYAALTEAHGGGEAARVVSRYVGVAAAALVPGARIVERVGDELLIVAEDTVLAVRTAVRLREAVEREPMFPTLRLGIHAGPALEEAGRFYGTALNVAARVAGHARAGQILCTDVVAARVGDEAGVDFRALGAVRFKNIAAPVEVVEVVAGSQAPVTVIDPVCRMQVSPDIAPARLPWDADTYYFCSFECARAFAADPPRYVGSR